MKNILITGASSGFGQAMAIHLSQSGHNVIGTSRNSRQSDNGYTMQELDVTSDESVKECIHRATIAFGHIDVLINNAGYGIGGPIEETPIEKAKAQFDTNFWGIVRMNQAVLPIMKKQGHGLIINTSSIGGLIGLPYQGFYAASKFALEGYTEALRMELHDSSISITNVCPGDFKTEFTANRSNPSTVSEDYFIDYSKVMSHYEENEKNGSDPSLVTELVEKIINKSGDHSVRYIVGKPIERFAVTLKGIIGSKTYEKIILKSLG